MTDLAAEAMATRLESLGIVDEDVLVCWSAFREGYKMAWRAFVAPLTDICGRRREHVGNPPV